MGIDEDIVVADTNNHRIQVFDKSGDFKYQFGIPGKIAPHTQNAPKPPHTQNVFISRNFCTLGYLYFGHFV